MAYAGHAAVPAPEPEDDDVVGHVVDGASDGELEQEDAAQMIREMGHHPIMDRVQATLFKQLSERDGRVVLQLREREEERRRITQRREDIGVELYGVQQQLAKKQVQLEGAHHRFQEVSGQRMKADEDVAASRQLYAARKVEVAKQREALEEAKSQLDALNRTLHQVDQYIEEMKGEIAVIRRATYKAEESATQMEKEKKAQDMYIAQLTEQVKRLHERRALLAAQLESQRGETQAATDTLAEAEQEIEAINFEIKQLVQQWKASLISMQRRDEALQATSEALRKQREAETAVRAEIAGYKSSLAKAQAEHESKTSIRDKLDGETAFLQEELGKVVAKRDRLAERFAILKKSLEQTDKEARRGEVELRNLRDQVAAVEASYQAAERERQQLEERIAETQSAQTTVSKAVANLAKTARRLQEKIHGKEMEQSQMENELSRIRVDSLNTRAHNEQLQRSLDALLSELQGKEKLTEKYEMEIRQRHDEIEKKMHTVDRLNRKYEQLTANMEDENTGPLEATIKNISKQISSTKQSNADLQREWLRSQTTLVEVVHETERESESVRMLVSEQTLMQQKKYRLDGSIGTARREVEELRRNITGMHADLTRLNELISRNRELQAKLADSNFTLEKDFVRELQELQEESVRMEANAAAVKREKDQMLEDIVEAERQIMLWEKKTLLEKETQAALDPEVGMAESRSMEKEIHRMRLRFEALQRDQERMIKEMERAIEKRELIALRQASAKRSAAAAASTTSLPSAGSTGELSRAAVRKRMAMLQRQLEKARQDVDGYERAVRQKEADMAALAAELEHASGEFGRLEDRANALQRAINDALYEKQRLTDRTAKYRRMLRRYDELARRSTRGGLVDDVRVERELAAAQQEQEQVRAVIRGLSGQFGKLGEVLTRVEALLDI